MVQSSVTSTVVKKSHGHRTYDIDDWTSETQVILYSVQCCCALDRQLHGATDWARFTRIMAVEMVCVCVCAHARSFLQNSGRHARLDTMI